MTNLTDWLAKNAIRLLMVTVCIALIVSFFWLRSCSRERTTASITKATERNDAAKDQAAIERRQDDAVIANQQQERTHAIDIAPAGETGPATRALNCQRWMQQHPGAAKPAGC